MRHEVMLKSNQQKLLHVIFYNSQLFLDVLFVLFFYGCWVHLCFLFVSLHEIFWNTLRIPERVFQAESFCVTAPLCGLEASFLLS